MSSFEARLRVPGQARLPLNVVIEITDDEIAFSTGDKPLGEWSLDHVRVQVRPDGFHVTLDNEEIVLTVTEPARFADALGVGARNRPVNGTASTPGEVAVISEHNGTSRNGLSSRLEGISPEEKFAEVIERIEEMKTALTDGAVPPEDFFARWLRLLKDINRRHGQGAMPTPLFYRLNTELLELLPSPVPRRPPELVTVDA